MDEPSSSPDSVHLSPAEEAFAEFLLRNEDGELLFDEFCARHPTLEIRLRRLHERWRAMDQAIANGLGAEDAGRADESRPL